MFGIGVCTWVLTSYKSYYWCFSRRSHLFTWMCLHSLWKGFIYFTWLAIKGRNCEFDFFFLTHTKSLRRYGTRIAWWKWREFKRTIYQTCKAGTLEFHCVPWTWLELNWDEVKIPWLLGWWFQIFFIFTPIWGRFPFWLIFFKWVETTNQYRLNTPFKYLQMLMHLTFCLVNSVNERDLDHNWISFLGSVLFLDRNHIFARSCVSPTKLHKNSPKELLLLLYFQRDKHL